MSAQRYTAEGDAVVVGGRWFCEHDDESQRELVDDGRRTVSCPDCATVWAPWDHGMVRLAKPVVQRMP